ncbi:hypothetical protein [Micromonospora avicenniae]|uniref:Uncharacterized protein n=1 Tax=Micromonospora avicenniae TaxID=1198245 RepID=A0A1N7AM51_9ACTN|nr:hypothetical protein [Micromonospora avicenniae]SIR40159.1 hypothetical protein SAMN05444858_109192 [Micromonospora avicenniae]
MDIVAEIGAEHLDALGEGDLRPLRRWLSGLLCRPGGLAVEEFDLLASLSTWDSALVEQLRLRSAIEHALTVAAPLPGAAPALLLYLEALFEEYWEEAWDIEPALEHMRFVGEGWSRLTAQGQAVDVATAGLVLQMIELLALEMVCYDAGYAGSLAAWSELAGRVAGRAERMLADAASCPPSPLSAFVTDQAGGDVRYYRAVSLAARAVHDHFTTGGSDVGGAIGTLREAEESLPDGIERSELRAHRYALEALAASVEQPWLRVEHGQIVYLYPFGLFEEVPGDGTWMGAPPSVNLPQELISAARREARDWTLAGCAIRDHPRADVSADLSLSDVWKGDDPHARQYRGMTIMLPDLEIRDVDRPEAEPQTFTVELRLSELGNHFLRIAGQLSGATPPQVYAAMVRVAPESGNLAQLGIPLRMVETDPSAPQWYRLSDFADRVISDLTGQLARATARRVRCSGRPGMYHVLLSVGRAALVSPSTGAVEPVRTAAELLSAFGAQPLCNPVRDGLSAVAEWLRYPVDAARLPVVDVSRFHGDLLMSSCNTTLMMTPGTPSYQMRSIAETAEFVASLDGMFASWQGQLASYHQVVLEKLAEMTTRLDRTRTGLGPAAASSSAHRDDVEELTELQGRLEALQLRMHAFVMSSRTVLMFLTAPSLVTSPAIRVTIDQLLAAARFGELRAEFEDMVDKVADRAGALVEASMRRQQEWAIAAARAAREREERELRLRLAREEATARRRAERERVNRRRIDILLGVVAAIGLSGVMQLIQAGYDLRTFWALMLALVVLAIAVLVGYVLHRLHRERQGPEADPAAGPVDGGGGATGQEASG